MTYINLGETDGVSVWVLCIAVDDVQCSLKNHICFWFQMVAKAMFPLKETQGGLSFQKISFLKIHHLLPLFQPGHSETIFSSPCMSVLTSALWWSRPHIADGNTATQHNVYSVKLYLLHCLWSGPEVVGCHRCAEAPPWMSPWPSRNHRQGWSHANHNSHPQSHTLRLNKRVWISWDWKSFQS